MLGMEPRIDTRTGARSAHATPTPIGANSEEHEPRVSVIIPAMNEEMSIRQVLEMVPSWVHEVVLVDGYSTDGTAQAAREVWPNHHVVVKERRQVEDRRGATRPGARDRRTEGRALRLVGQTRRGKGNALKTGIAAATGDIVVMIDADGSTDPREIGRFVQTLRNGADFAKGSRFLKGAGTDDMSFDRKIGNGALVLLANVLFGTRYTDITYGYNAFWKRHAGALALEIDGWANEIITNIRIARHGLNVVEVPSFELPRIAGEAKLQGVYLVGWRILRAILAERLRPRPARGVLPTRDEIPTVMSISISDDTVTLRPEGTEAEENAAVPA
jgi:glycosyltransferase involved in cell wall biosynthesis